MSSTSVEQLHRYAIVSELSRGKVVLEIGLGEVYGSSLIAQAAKKVVGMDVTPGLVKYARGEDGKDKLFIVRGRYTQIPLANGRVDLVISFGITEHFNQGESMMAEIARVLRPGGIVIISSPYSSQSPERPTQQNPATLSADFVSEYESLLRSKFRNVAVFAQRIAFGSYIEPLINQAVKVSASRISFAGDFIP